MKRIAYTILAAKIMIGLTSAFAGTYAIDDGTGESSIGFMTTAGSDAIWMNGFQATADNNAINEVQISFGAKGSVVALPHGHPVTAIIWEDPTNDADPSDASLLATIPGTVQFPNSDTFVSFSLPTPLTLQTGDWFYVGFNVDTRVSGISNFAAANDTSGLAAGVSWFAGELTGGAVDYGNLGSSNVFGSFEDLGFSGNALIRAVGAPVPEPSSLSLVALGLLITISSARRRRIVAA